CPRCGHPITPDGRSHALIDAPLMPSGPGPRCDHFPKGLPKWMEYCPDCHSGQPASEDGAARWVCGKCWTECDRREHPVCPKCGNPITPDGRPASPAAVPCNVPRCDQPRVAGGKLCQSHAAAHAAWLRSKAAKDPKNLVRCPECRGYGCSKCGGSGWASAQP